MARDAMHMQRGRQPLIMPSLSSADTESRSTDTFHMAVAKKASPSPDHGRFMKDPRGLTSLQVRTGARGICSSAPKTHDRAAMGNVHRVRCRS